jgi:hypothetical protein
MSFFKTRLDFSSLIAMAVFVSYLLMPLFA